MVGGEVAGKTAVVLLGTHRLHSLAGFLSEGVGAAGFADDRPGNTLLFWESRARLGKKLKPSFFVTQKEMN
jgi:hypothetical protein